MSTTTQPPPRERPILFRDEMVRAILDGRKTQTRRAWPEQTPQYLGDRTWTEVAPGLWAPLAGGLVARVEDAVRCPWRVGDVLWVREAWLQLDRDHFQESGPAEKRVADSPVPRLNGIAFRADTTDEGDAIRAEYGYRWRPSIHLPRRFARLFLRVLAVRAERVNAISEDGARAEGVLFDGTYWLGDNHPIKGVPKSYPTARDAFASLWDSMHGAGSFAFGAWVWVVEFERVEAPR